MRLGVLFAAATILGMVAPAAGTSAADAPPCTYVEGTDQLLAKGRIVLLGEIHGTAESPEFVEMLTCHALAEGLGVTVALELPQDEQAAVSEFLGGAEAGVGRILELPFWSREYQDGRGSRAMLGLLESIRLRRQAGERVRVILLDRPQLFNMRDQEMAARLLSVIEESPEDFFVTLTGNFHSRTAAGSGKMGALVLGELGADRVLSLNVSHAGGTAWICEATAGCGPLDLNGRGEGPGPRITLFAEPDARGYHGTYYVGSITASPPARAAAAQ